MIVTCNCWRTSLLYHYAIRRSFLRRIKKEAPFFRVITEPLCYCNNIILYSVVLPVCQHRISFLMPVFQSFR